LTALLWPSRDVAELADWIRERTGLVFPPSRLKPAAAAMARAAERLGSADARSMLARLERDPAALEALLADLTIGETYFFRHPEQLEVIREQVLPDLARAREGLLRAWSAGCATGEEPYSLAILLQEAGLGGTSRVLGTDLSSARLAVARRGRYRSWSLRGVPDTTVERYFAQRDSWYQLAPHVVAAVDFRELNLVDDPYPDPAKGVGKMDLILCRNVLIYLEPSAVERVARKLVDSLTDGGWLFLGASDPMIVDLAPVEVVVTGAGLAYRRAAAGGARAVGWAPPAPAPPPREPRTRLAPVHTPPKAAPESLATTRAMPAPADLAELERWYQEQRYDAVVAAATDLVERGEGGPDACVLLVRSLANQGMLSEAGRASAAALDVHRDSAELLYLHALLLLEGGRPREALEAARRAVYLDRGLVVAHLALADACSRTQDEEGARRALRNAERLLQRLPADAPVPGSDGEPAGRILRMVELRLGRLNPPHP
jgi:chemotaxis protein methyltransferase CheR